MKTYTGRVNETKQVTKAQIILTYMDGTKRVCNNSGKGYSWRDKKLHNLIRWYENNEDIENIEVVRFEEVKDEH